MRAVVVLLLLAAAAVGLWVAFGGKPGKSQVQGPDGAVARSLVVMPDAEGAARNLIHVYEPVDGQAVAMAELDQVTFRWASVEGAPAYMYVANNEFGTMVWRTTTRDTTLKLPAKVIPTLVPGERLKWIVQVPPLSASTDLHRIELE